jgi:hypothetical protein
MRTIHASRAEVDRERVVGKAYDRSFVYETRANTLPTLQALLAPFIQCD